MLASLAAAYEQYTANLLTLTRLKAPGQPDGQSTRKQEFEQLRHEIFDRVGKGPSGPATAVAA